MTDERRQRVVQRVREILVEAEGPAKKEDKPPLILIDGGLKRGPEKRRDEPVNTVALPERSPIWRDKRIAAIRLRCRELGIEDWRRRTLREKYGVSSVTKLDDGKLEAFYRMVMKNKLRSRFC